MLETAELFKFEEQSEEARGRILGSADNACFLFETQEISVSDPYSCNLRDGVE